MLVKGRIFEEDLFELYALLTDHRGTKRGLTKVMRDSDFEKQPTTRQGEKSYYYAVKSLAHYKPREFHEESADVIKLKGV